MEFSRKILRILAIFAAEQKGSLSIIVRSSFRQTCWCVNPIHGNRYAAVWTEYAGIEEGDRE